MLRLKSICMAGVCDSRHTLSIILTGISMFSLSLLKQSMRSKTLYQIHLIVYHNITFF